MFGGNMPNRFQSHQLHLSILKTHARDLNEELISVRNYIDSCTEHLHSASVRMSCINDRITALESLWRAESSSEISRASQIDRVHVPRPRVMSRFGSPMIYTHLGYSGPSSAFSSPKFGSVFRNNPNNIYSRNQLAHSPNGNDDGSGAPLEKEDAELLDPQSMKDPWWTDDDSDNEKEVVGDFNKIKIQKPIATCIDIDDSDGYCEIKMFEDKLFSATELRYGTPKLLEKMRTFEQKITHDLKSLSTRLDQIENNWNDFSSVTLQDLDSQIQTIKSQFELVKELKKLNELPSVSENVLSNSDDVTPQQNVPSPKNSAAINDDRDEILLLSPSIEMGRSAGTQANSRV